MKHKAITNLCRRCLLCLWLAGGLWAMSTTAAQPTTPEKKQVELTEPERAWIQKHPAVYWVMDPHWPPFSSFDKNGHGAGISCDLVSLIAKRTGLNLKLVRTESWSQTLHKVINGEADIVVGIARTEERERLLGLRFTEPYCKFPTAIITRKDTDFLTMLEDIRMRRIALPRDYATTEEIRRNHPDAHFVITNTEEQCMRMVAADQADATVLNVASAGYLVHMRGLANLKISGFADVEFFLRLGVRNDVPELYSILSKGLATINPEEREAIYARHILLETRREIDWRTWRNRALYSMLIAGVTVAIVLAWNRSLARQIRRREAVESALLQAQQDLEARARESDRHAAAMDALNAKLTAANKDLGSFSYSISHDLKSPLRRLRGYADLLQEDAGSLLNEDTREFLNGIQLEAGRMQELINALLLFARIGRMEMHLAPVNMGQLTRQIVDELQPETKGRDIAWKIHPLPEIEGDEGLLRRAMANLIDNAVKFTRGRAPARIEIGVLPAKPGDTEVVFYVRDNGAGFDMQDADRLFESFQRLHSQTEFEGSGLGLANVRRIIQRHGGRVWAEGKMGEGATFYFALPRSESRLHEPAT